MGLANIRPGSLLLILFIIFFLFGTKRFQTIGKDLSDGIKAFREGLRETPPENKDKP